VSPLAFHYYATEYLEAAPRARAHAGERFSPVPYFLYCRTIELVLKAFLLAKGVPKRVLKDKIGHSLSAALSRARREGLDDVITLKPEELKQIQKASPQYLTKEFEYFEVFHMVTRSQLPDLGSLEVAASRLVRDLKQVCVNAA